jgi:hypothetical protein
VIWLEVVLGFAIPVGWGVWELVSLKREKQRDKQRDAAKGDR